MGIFRFFKKRIKEVDTEREQTNTSENAIEYYTDAIARSPQNANLYVERGKAYEALKEYGLAIQDFGTAIQLDPQESYFYMFLRYRQHLFLGDLDKALADIKQAVSLAPNSYMYEHHLARLYEKLGQRDSAIMTLNQGVERFPASKHAYLARSEFYEQIGYLEEALKDITQVIKLEPQWWHLHRRAKIYVRMGRFDDALDDCNQCIEMQPMEWTHFRVRSEVYDAMGNHWAAKADYEKSMDLNPNINR